MKNALIIFSKNAEYGKVKTRLAAGIGNDEALNVYKQLLQYTFSITENVTADKYIFYSNYVEEIDAATSSLIKKVQHGNDLGERMLNAFTEIFKMNYEKAIIIGTDCFELTAAHIQIAFNFLNENEVVIGPAFDGGYYLLGMKKTYPFLFENINWSSSKVLQQTLAICGKHSLQYALLEKLNDIDEEKDWLDYKMKINTHQ